MKQNIRVLFGKSAADYFEMNGYKNSIAASILEGGFTNLVLNFNASQAAVFLGSKFLIASVTDRELDNSPMCSPYNLFCVYPKKRIHVIKNYFLRKFLDVSTSLFAVTFRLAKIDCVVQVNNKPCDAILYPNLTAEEIDTCKLELKSKFPKHGIIFPRIDKLSRKDLCENLEKAGFLMVPTRAVHIFDPANNFMKKSHSKRDVSFLKKSDYTQVAHDEIDEQDLIRIHELYQKLFIEKHSPANPDLTLKFFKDSHSNRWYTFCGLRNRQGIIDAFYSYEELEDSMACGPLGYDSDLPQEIGLYRMIFAIALQIADKKTCMLNFGGANDVFKMNRGSTKEIGYTAVYCKHLPIYRRLPWLFLAKLGGYFTVRILKKVSF